ncbi:SurA N-terminal domain-containing protein [uncultured Desulfovibrio sp.]|uniref:SurA N-terminal domain-containing protein n=1 Tax=uncultured Desulfovibrio sp. TaxID=167968 RepID=UPI0026063F10|nr:SurA N-terminal domain-containing protein [uncultured Desulfovibrio sp.]
MLDFIRSNAQSMGVKLIFGLIILVFIFWGVGSITDTSGGTVVAVVNGEGISASAYQQAYQQQVEAIQRSNPGITREQLAQQNVGERVLTALIMQKLLEQEATRMGVSVSAQEMRQAVETVDAFKNKDGAFDAEIFRRMVENAYGSVGAFEKKLREELLAGKLESLVRAGIWSNSDESRAFFEYLRQKRGISYAFVPASRFAAEVKLTDKDIADYYAAHKQDFAVPAKVVAEYVKVSPLLLVKPESVSAADVEAEYTKNVSRYQTPEMVKAAHILVPLAEKATPDEVKQAEESMAAIRKELAGGKSFAQVADAHNGPNAAGPGGELGWIQRGQTVQPFEEAVFALEPGKLSETVRTPFGLHVILVSEKKPAGTRPFSEVEGEIRAELARQLGVEKLNDALDALVEDNILKKPLGESAARFGLSAARTDLLSAAELEKTLGLSAENAALVMGTGSGNPVDSALEAGDGYLVVRVDKAEAAHTPELDAVRGEIEKRLKAEKMLSSALSAAAEELKQGQDGKELTLSTASVERDGVLSGFVASSELAQAVFGAPLKTWLPRAFRLESEKEGPGALICRVDGVQEADPAEWEAMRESFDGLLRNRRGEELFQLFLGELQRKAEVRQNPELIRQIVN